MVKTGSLSVVQMTQPRQSSPGEQVAHGQFAVLQQAENLQANGVGDGFEQPGDIIDLGVFHGNTGAQFYGGHVLEFNVMVNQQGRSCQSFSVPRERLPDRQAGCSGENGGRSPLFGKSC